MYIYIHLYVYIYEINYQSSIDACQNVLTTHQPFSFPSKTFFHQGTFGCKCRVPSLCPPPKNLQANVDPHKRHSRNCRKETRILPRKKREVYLNSGGDWGIYLSWQINSRHKSVKMIRTIIRWNPYAKHRVFPPQQTSSLHIRCLKVACEKHVSTTDDSEILRLHQYSIFICIIHIYTYICTLFCTHILYMYISAGSQLPLLRGRTTQISWNHRDVGIVIPN